jgi:hypothetical protein
MLMLRRPKHQKSIPKYGIVPLPSRAVALLQGMRGLCALPALITLSRSLVNLLHTCLSSAIPSGVGIALGSRLCTSHQYLFATAPTHRANSHNVYAIMGASMHFVSEPGVYSAADFATGAQLLLAAARPGLCLHNCRSKSDPLSFICRFIVTHFGFEGGINSKEQTVGSIFVSQATHRSWAASVAP